MAKNIKRRRRDKLIIIISITVMVLSVIAVLGVLLLNARLFDESGGILNSQPEEISIPHELEDEYINFLVVGLDESENLTDVIMVVSLDVQSKSAHILQIPRDSYVGNVTTGKINAVYGSGDPELEKIDRLIKEINTQFMLPISHYVTVTLDSFRSAVDAMGGIEVDMPYSIDQDGFVIPEGEQVLDGEAAEILVRHRSSYIEGDIGRIKASRIFLSAAFAQAKGMGLGEIVNVAQAVYGEFTTDMSLNEIKDIADALMDFDMDNIHMHLLPGESVGASYALNPTGLSIWSMHKQETADLLNEYFRPYTNSFSAEELGIVEIRNTTDWYSDNQDSMEDVISGNSSNP